ncbi:hypothetical protein [Paenibacillus sp. FSL L8-0333]|uniref:hypothetical protein n=1 Tax=Paenibacillus sp. FSL L8-0333 TaxID=2975331 RepID=UPI0030D11E1C
MSIYLISYDLNDPGKDYAALWEAIENLGPFIKPLESVYFVATTLRSDQIVPRLTRVMDLGDGLVVTPIEKDPTGGQVDPEVWKWLSAH